ncbi:MAG TPA: YfhO family protein [Sandaracinaceae bacterium]
MSAPRDRGSAAIAIATIALATAFLFWPMVVSALAGEPRFFEWDVPEQYWPDLVFLCESLHRGELPYWNPYDRAGYPYYADPQAAAYHPSSWLLCALAGPKPALGWASARVVFGFALAGLFGLLWLRRLGASWSGAIAGAVVIEAAPFMRHNWELNLTGALAYLPLVLWAADRVAFERRALDGVVLALAVALCGWMGSPPALWLASTLTVLYLAFRLGEAAREGRPLRGALPALGVAAVLTAGLLGVVVGPGLELARHSVQANRGFVSIADGGLAPERLLALVWPQPGNHLYVGLAAITLGVYAAARGPRRLSLFFWAVAIVAVLMAMGAHGPLFRFAFEHVPGVRAFRLPHRYEAWLGPAFGALAALGLTALARKWPRAGAAWIGALVALVTLADVGRALPEERHTRAGPPPAREDVARRIFASAPGTRERWRVMDEFAVTCRAGTRHRRRDLRGYQDPLLLASYERVVDALRAHPELAPQFNVRFALQGPHFLHGWNRHYLPPPAELRARLRARVRYEDAEERSVTELLDALPLAYFVPSTEVEAAPDRPRALARVIELAPSAIAVVEGEASGTARPRARPRAAARDVELSADALSFVIDAPSDGVVVVNETYYPGWRATVDGREVEIVRANALVRAVPVTAGRHRVQMRFAPRDGRILRAVWLASLLASLLAIGWSLGGRRRWRAPRP